MERTEFWQLVEAARREVGRSADAADEVAQGVIDRLARLSPDEIIGFGAELNELLRGDSYRNDLWAAAYLMNDGCSDDGFDYFRGWLIAQGRSAWDGALADPDSLAGVVDPELAREGAQEVQCEEMLYVASSAHQRATGGDEGFWDGLPTVDHVGGVAGEDFDFDDEEEMRVRLPRLSALYLGPTPRPPSG